ncbi:hypothetical protein Tco_0696596 [Tanacetum coccineum]
MSVRPCCFSNPRTASPPYQPFSPPSDYTSGAPPTSPIISPPLSPIKTNLNENCLLTPKTTPPLLTSPPPAPTQPSKLTSPVTINLDPIELLFATLPSSPFLLDVLGDLPPSTTNPLPPRPSFATIEHMANELPPIPPMNSSFPSPTPKLEPTPPPLPPQCLPPPPPQISPLLPLGPNNPFPLLTHEMFCEHCQRTQVLIDNLQGEMRFILNHILDRLNVIHLKKGIAKYAKVSSKPQKCLDLDSSYLIQDIILLIDEKVRAHKLMKNSFDSKHEALDPSHANDARSLDEELSSEEDLDEDECRVVYKNKQKSALEVDLKNSSKDMEDTINDDNFTRNLPNQSPLAELNPRGFLLPFTISNYNSYAMANIDASNNVMPRSICEYLMLDNLEGASMSDEIDNLTQRETLGTVKNASLKIDKFEFPCDFEEISLGTGKDRIKFGVNENLRPSSSPIEKIYMANTSQEEESFNPFEIRHDMSGEDECGLLATLIQNSAMVITRFSGKTNRQRLDNRGQSFICITKHDDDALPLGRVNGARFKAMIRKELKDKDVTHKETFIRYPFDYHVTLGFGSIAGGLDPVSPVIRLPIERGINSGTKVIFDEKKLGSS